MSIILSGMAAGAGDAGVKAGLEYEKNAGDMELQKARDEAHLARETTLQKMRDESQVNLERNVKQPHDIAMQENRFTNEGNLQDKRIGADKSMQDTRLEAVAKERVLDRTQQSSEGDKNRSVQREGQAIHAAQVGIMAKGAELDREIKTIELKNKKDLDGMRAAYAEESDPAKRAQISDNIHILTGKDTEKYLPVPLKDEMGNVTGYQIFDKNRGQFVDQKPGAAATGAKWDNGTGSVMVDGKVIGQAKSESEARELVAKHRKPAAAPSAAKPAEVVDPNAPLTEPPGTPTAASDEEIASATAAGPARYRGKGAGIIQRELNNRNTVY